MYNKQFKRSSKQASNRAYLGQWKAIGEPRQQTIDHGPLLDRNVEQNMRIEEDDLDRQATRASMVASSGEQVAEDLAHRFGTGLLFHGTDTDHTLAWARNGLQRA
jgi:hypothetical protein